MNKHNNKSKKTSNKASTTISNNNSKKDKAFAITSFVCGLLFWVPLFNTLIGPIAIIFGILAIRRVRENPERYGGQGYAIAGLILGLMSVIFTIIGWYVTLVHPELLTGINQTIFSR